MLKVTKYVLIDILRSRVILFYTLFLLAISIGLFMLEDNDSKAIVSLLNVILFIVPLITLIFSTIYLYDASEFIQLLISQPIPRRRLITSLYVGIFLSLAIAFIVGACLPLLLLSGSSASVIMCISGLFLTAIFVSIAFVSSVSTRDKAKGIGLAILIWLYFSLIYDGLVLLAIFQFNDYPLENVMIALCTLNPIDLSRITILLKLDVSALMGFTGALFNEFFGTTMGALYVGSMMVIWLFIPIRFAIHKFGIKDL